jgi:uncharacterized protein YjbI with pentapeptide repeats
MAIVTKTLLTKPLAALTILLAATSIVAFWFSIKDQSWAAVPILMLIMGSTLAMIGWNIWKRDRDEPGSRSDLGAALLGGAVVAFIVFGLQLVSEQQRERLTEHQSLQLTIGLSRDLGGADLAGRDLTGFYFQGKDLREANLRGAVLVEANLTRANVGGADLREADLRRANLSEAQFTDPKICPQEAQLQGAVLEGATMKFANLTKMQLAGINFRAANLEFANFDEANLQNADLRSSQLFETSFVGADLRGADLRDTKFKLLDDLYSSEYDIYEAFKDVTFDNRTQWPIGFDPKHIKAHSGHGGGSSSCF